MKDNQFYHLFLLTQWLTCSVPEATDEIGTLESLQYDFDTISNATDDFSDANKLRRGGFGAVYRVIEQWHITNKDSLVL